MGHVCIPVEVYAPGRLGMRGDTSLPFIKKQFDSKSNHTIFQYIKSSSNRLDGYFMTKRVVWCDRHGLFRERYGESFCLRGVKPKTCALGK